MVGEASFGRTLLRSSIPKFRPRELLARARERACILGLSVEVNFLLLLDRRAAPRHTSGTTAQRAQLARDTCGIRVATGHKRAIRIHSPWPIRTPSHRQGQCHQCRGKCPKCRICHSKWGGLRPRSQGQLGQNHTPCPTGRGGDGAFEGSG